MAIKCPCRDSVVFGSSSSVYQVHPRPYSKNIELRYTWRNLASPIFVSLQINVLQAKKKFEILDAVRMLLSSSFLLPCPTTNLQMMIKGSSVGML